MTPAPNNRQPHGAPRLLAAALLAVLAASVLFAYTLVLASRADIRAAESILAQLRQNGLTYYWSSDDFERQYAVIDRDGKIISRSAVKRIRTDTGYEGGSQEIRGPVGAVELWTISDDATEGQYAAESSIGAFSKTAISLDGAELTVISGDRIAKTETPANYIPEGLLELIVRLVAASERDATFSMILNEGAIADGSVLFVDILMKPLSPSQVEVNIPAIGPAGMKVYYLDDDGEVSKVDYPVQGISLQHVEPAQPAAGP